MFDRPVVYHVFRGARRVVIVGKTVPIPHRRLFPTAMGIAMIPS
ncbi:hypothetical protein Y88_1897 [Novosphingobium nitrogenifigens DSM 19370]|uniref:Uncharacterized protein n=1 Tax=Novosphingobium nitrogenifigens DSM 19370 TaxID=983920 RepID=F1Z558_9SPHN|nr:hypothetical protein Y88_1897 [Novosphingobium nitrogenifigens DSM 19370]